MNLPDIDFTNRSLIQTSGDGTIDLDITGGLFFKENALMSSKDGDIKIDINIDNKDPKNSLDKIEMADSSSIGVVGTSNISAGCIHINTESSLQNCGDCVLGEVKTNSDKNDAIVLGKDQLRGFRILDGNGQIENIVAPNGRVFVQSSGGFGANANFLETRVAKIKVLNTDSGDIAFSQHQDMFVEKIDNDSQNGGVFIDSSGNINLMAGQGGLRSKHGEIDVKSEKVLTLPESGIASTQGGDISVEASRFDLGVELVDISKNHILLSGSSGDVLIKTSHTDGKTLFISKPTFVPGSSFEWISKTDRNQTKVFSSRILGGGFGNHKLTVVDSLIQVKLLLPYGDKFESKGTNTTHTVDEVIFSQEGGSFEFNLNDSNKELHFSDLNADNQTSDCIVNSTHGSLKFSNFQGAVVLLDSSPKSILKEEGDMLFESRGDPSLSKIAVNGNLSSEQGNIKLWSDGSFSLGRDARVFAKLGDIEFIQSDAPHGSAVTNIGFNQELGSSVETENGTITISVLGEMRLRKIISQKDSIDETLITLNSRKGALKDLSSDFGVRALKGGISLSAFAGMGEETSPLHMNAYRLDLSNSDQGDIFLKEEDSLRVGDLSNQAQGHSSNLLVIGNLFFENSTFLLNETGDFKIEGQTKIAFPSSGSLNFQGGSVSLKTPLFEFPDQSDPHIILKGQFSMVGLEIQKTSVFPFKIKNMATRNNALSLVYGASNELLPQNSLDIRVEDRSFDDYRIAVLNPEKNLSIDIEGGDKIFTRGSQIAHYIDEVILKSSNAKLSYQLKNCSESLILFDKDKDNRFSSKSIVSRDGSLVLKNDKGSVLLEKDDGAIDILGGGSLEIVSGSDHATLSDPRQSHGGSITLRSKISTNLGDIELKACERILLEEGTSVSSEQGRIEMDLLNGNEGIFTQEEGSIIETHNTIAIRTQGDLKVSAVKTSVNTPSNGVVLESKKGKIIDGGDRFCDIDAPDASVLLKSFLGMGDDDSIETNIKSLSASNGSLGKISLIEKDALSIVQLENESTSDRISVVTGDTISILGQGVHSKGASIVLDVHGNPKGDIFVNAPIRAENFAEVTLSASDTIFLSDTEIRSENGDIRLLMNTQNQRSDGTPSFLMTDQSKISVYGDTPDNAGTVEIKNDGSHTQKFVINEIKTNSNKNNSVMIKSPFAQRAQVEAVSRQGEHILAPDGGLVIISAGGVGSSNFPLKTEIRTLDLVNRAFGDVFLKEKDSLSVNALHNLSVQGDLSLHCLGDLIFSGNRGLLSHGANINIVVEGVNSDIIFQSSASLKGEGDLTLKAPDSIVMQGDSTLRSVDGAITLTVDSDNSAGDSGNRFVMDAQSQIVVTGTDPSSAGQIRIENQNIHSVGRSDAGQIKITGIQSNSDRRDALFIGGDLGTKTWIEDAGDNHLDISIPNGGVVLNVSSGIGDGNSLNTDIAFVSAKNRIENDVAFLEKNGVFVSLIKNQASGGLIELLAGSSVQIGKLFSIEEEGLISNGGDIICKVLNDSAGDIVHYGVIKTLGQGEISLVAEDSIFFKKTASLESVNGDIEIVIDRDDLSGDSGDIFVMDHLSRISVLGDTPTSAGVIAIKSMAQFHDAGSFSVSSVSTNSNNTRAIEVSAVHSHTVGVVKNSEGGSRTIFSCPNGGLFIDVASGIGSEDAVRIDAAKLDVLNRSSQNIRLLEDNELQVERISNRANGGALSLESLGTVHFLNQSVSGKGDIHLHSHGNIDFERDFFLELMSGASLTLDAQILSSPINRNPFFKFLGEKHFVKISCTNIENTLDIDKVVNDEESTFALKCVSSSQAGDFRINFFNNAFSTYDVLVKKSEHKISLNLPNSDKIVSQGDLGLTGHILDEVILKHSSADLKYTFFDGDKRLILRDLGENNLSVGRVIHGGSGNIYLKNMGGAISNLTTYGKVYMEGQGDFILEADEDLNINGTILSSGKIGLHSKKNIFLNRGGRLLSGRSLLYQGLTGQSGDIEISAGEGESFGMIKQDCCFEIFTDTGKISMKSYGDIFLSWLETRSHAKDAVLIDICDGFLIDNDNSRFDIRAPNGGVDLRLSKGVHDNQFIETNILQLRASNRSSGSILIHEDNDLKVTSLKNTAPAGKIIVRSKGSLSVDYFGEAPSVCAEGGDIFLESYSDEDNDLSLNGLIKTSGDGEIFLQTTDSLFLKKDCSVEGEDGNISLIANTDSFAGDSGDQVSMFYGSRIRVLGSTPQDAGVIFIKNSGGYAKTIDAVFREMPVVKRQCSGCGCGSSHDRSAKSPQITISKIMTNASELGIEMDCHKGTVFRSVDKKTVNLMAKNALWKLKSPEKPVFKDPLNVMVGSFESPVYDFDSDSEDIVFRDKGFGSGVEKIALGFIQTNSDNNFAINIYGGQETSIVDNASSRLTNLRARNGGLLLSTGLNIGEVMNRIDLDVLFVKIFGEGKEFFLNNSRFPLFDWGGKELSIVDDNMSEVLRFFDKQQVDDLFVDPMTYVQIFDTAYIYKGVSEENLSFFKDSLTRPEEIFFDFPKRNFQYISKFQKS